MTNLWFSQTPNPPRTPVFYTLTKIHKPTPVGRPVISGCDGPTERLSAFVDKLLQPIAKEQESYLKDSTDFINFIEKTRIPENAILVSMDVTSLYTNIPQEEGIETVCEAYESYYEGESPIPTQYLKRALELILQENSFEFTGKNYLQTPGVKKGFIKGEALRLLRTNSSETAFKTAISQFKTNLIERGYPETLVSTTLTEITFEERKPALQQKHKQDMQILPFVTQYRPSVPNLKQILMQNWHLIQQQPLLTRIFKDPPIVSYKRGRSLKDILVRAEL